MILFPELSICGYPPRDLVERSTFVERNRTTAEHIANETQGIAVICGMVTPAEADSGKTVRNSAALLRDGRIDFIQSKMLLPTYDVFDEMRNFAPAPSQQLFSFCGQQMALTICEDAWNDKSFWDRRLYRVDPIEELVRRGRPTRAQYFRFTVLAGQARTATRYAGGDRQKSARAGGDGQPGRG